MTAPLGGSVTGGQLIRRAYREEWRRVAAGITGLSLHQLCETMVPVAIGLVIDHAVVPRDGSALGIGIIGLCLLFTVLTLAYRIGARILYVAVQRQGHRLRVRIAAHALHARSPRTSLRSGELLSIASTDADLTGMTLRLSAFATGAVVAIATSAVVLLGIDLVLGVGVFIGVPVIVGLLHLLAPWMTRRAAEQQAAIARTTAMATDLVRGVRVLRGIGAERQALARYEGASQQAYGAALAAARWRGLLLGSSEAASGVLLTAVAGLAGWFALDGRITVGEFVTVIGLAQFIAEPVRMLGGVAEDLGTFRASANRVAEFVRSPLVADDGEHDAPARCGIALEAVSYRSLSDVDIAFEPGEVVGVVTHDPRDADALGTLLAASAEPDDVAGLVRIGDVAIREATLESVRKAVLAEPHDVALLEGTLEENLRLGKRDETGPSLDSVLAATSADDVVASHPAGLDRRLSERGADLSGGQRQRIALGRALLADAGVLVLSDPTTAVDAVTEAHIADGLVTLRRQDPSATTVLITASPALLARTDRVVVIDEGHVVAEGTHDDLLAADPTYRTRVTR